jgi:2-keto-3-deoxy-L-rhamnonate aldolase RhmA
MFNFGALGLRARLARNLPLGVFWMSTGSSAVMELAASAAPDAIVIDAQHGLWDRQNLEHAVGLVSNRVPVLVRTADASPIAISQALDSGAEGVIVPLIETDTQAAAAVAAARFPPHGSRSGGGVRPLAHDFARYYAAANDRTVVGVMI